MKFLSLFLLVIVIAVTKAILAKKLEKPKPLTFRAIFGSCNKHDLDQSHWPHLFKKAMSSSTTRQDKLDAIVWGGDIVYQDYMPVPVWPHFVRVNESEMEYRWNFFKNHKEYKDVVAKTTMVIGVTDDHENYNDCGKEAPMKDTTQKMLLDFLDVSNDVKNNKEAKVRRTQRKGVYAFHKFPLNNPNNMKNENSASNVCFIMLDTRYHRDAPRGDGKGDVLGDEQWTWLQKVLQYGRDPEIEDEKTKTEIKTIDDACIVTFIQSGVQVIADSQPMENWGEFPEARDRLLRILGASGSDRFIILSGDVHYGEINKLSALKINNNHVKKEMQLHEEREDTKQEQPPLYTQCGESPFPFADLIEVTSSGMTHRVHPLFADSDRYQRWFPSHRRTQDGAYMRENAGIIEIDCPVDFLADGEALLSPDLRSCNIVVTIVALPDATQEVAKVAVNFALDKASIMRRKLELPLHEQVLCNSINSPDVYRLPTYFAPWTEAIMWTKLHFPFGLFFEEGRLTLIFVHAWIIVLSVAFVLFFMCRFLFCRGGGKKNSKKNKQE